MGLVDPDEGVQYEIGAEYASKRFSTLLSCYFYDMDSYIVKARGFGGLTEKFLNALVASDMLMKNDSLYRNTPLASLFLVKERPFFQGHLLALMSKTRQERWANLDRCLKKGPIQPQKPIFDKNFIVAMAEGAMGNSLHRVVETVASLPEFKGSRKLIDIGGGHGLYAIAFSQINPQLESVVFDLPPVMETTRTYIKEYEMEDKVKAMPGDYTKDDWGNGFDIAFASNALYRPGQELLPVLLKIRDSLNPNGLFIYKHMMMDEERTSPAATVFFDLMISLIGESSENIFTEKEATTLFEKAGFEVERFDCSAPSKPSVVFVCRKGEIKG